jgi:hypothetical protein
MTRVGTKKMYFLIKSDLDQLDIKCGRDKLHAILRSEGMLIKKKKNYLRTTNSYHRFYKYPNLIKNMPQKGLDWHLKYFDKTDICSNFDFNLKNHFYENKSSNFLTGIFFSWYCKRAG